VGRKYCDSCCILREEIRLFFNLYCRTAQYQWYSEIRTVRGSTAVRIETVEGVTFYFYCFKVNFIIRTYIACCVTIKLHMTRHEGCAGGTFNVVSVIMSHLWFPRHVHCARRNTTDSAVYYKNTVSVQVITTTLRGI
jgi:hypothetical protein